MMMSSDHEGQRTCENGTCSEQGKQSAHQAQPQAVQRETAQPNVHAMQSSTTLGVKIVLPEGLIRRFRVTRELSLQQFWGKLRHTFHRDTLTAVSFQYRDPESEWVQCDCEEEWQEALLLSPHLLRIRLLGSPHVATNALASRKNLKNTGKSSNYHQRPPSRQQQQQEDVQEGEEEEDCSPPPTVAAAAAEQVVAPPQLRRQKTMPSFQSSLLVNKKGSSNGRASSAPQNERLQRLALPRPPPITNYRHSFGDVAARSWPIPQHKEDITFMISNTLNLSEFINIEQPPKPNDDNPPLSTPIPNELDTGDERIKQWYSQLATLNEMGFSYQPFLLDLLDKFNGSVSSVVQALMAPRGYTPISIKTSSTEQQQQPQQQQQQPQQQVSGGTFISLMSFNIRFDNEYDKMDSWVHRRQGIVEYILLKYNPDVFGLQEALGNQYKFIQQHLPQYSSISVGREYDEKRGEHFGEHSSIFYNSQKFTILNSGTFWLSETPDKLGTRGWDADCTRICTWCILQCTASPRDVVLVANTHWDHVGVKARLNSATLLKNYLSKIMSTSNPQPSGAVIMGDFNCENNSEALVTLQTKTLGSIIDLYNARDQLERERPIDVLGPKSTFTGFDGKFDERIDHFFVSKSITCKRYVCLDDLLPSGRRPSDHRPISILIEFPTTLQ